MEENTDARKKVCPQCGTKWPMPYGGLAKSLDPKGALGGMAEFAILPGLSADADDDPWQCEKCKTIFDNRGRIIIITRKKWNCYCKALGCFTVRDGDDIDAIIEANRREHKRISPNCPEKHFRIDFA